MATTHNDFGSQTEAVQVATAFSNSIRDKTIVIIGVGPNGLGGGMATTLAAQQPKLLVLGGRDKVKIESIQQDVKNSHPSVNTRVLVIDLISYDSIRDAAKELLGPDSPEIDILINNAGVMNIPTKQLSPAGYELHLATNHLGPFLLTKLLLPKLVANDGARVVNVSSNSHVFQPFRFSDYNFDEKSMPETELPNKQLCDMFGLPYGLGYLPVMAYGQSKTASILHAAALNDRYGKEGITAIACHPGAINTQLWRHMPAEVTEATQKMLPMKTIGQGISTPLVAALDPKLKGIKVPFLEDCQQGTAQQCMPYAYDPQLADKLWVLSEQLTQA